MIDAGTVRRRPPALRLPAGRRASVRAAGAWAGALAAALVAGLLVAHGKATYALLAAVAVAFLLWAISRPEQAALVLVALAPFSIYPVTVGTFSVFLELPLLTATAIILLARHRGTLARARGRLPVVAFAVLIAVGVVTAALSSSPTTAGSRILYLFVFGLFAAGLASSIWAGRMSERGLAQAVVVATAVAGVAIIVQVVAQFAVGADRVTTWLINRLPLFAGAHAAAELGQLNWTVSGLNIVRGIFPFMDAPAAGQSMMLGLIAAVWLRLDPRSAGSWIQRRAGLIATVVIAAGLLMTFSRQSWVGAFAGFGALALRRRPMRMVALILGLFLLMSVAPAPGTHESFANYLLSAGNTSTTSSATRLALWSQAIALVPGHWVIGVGAGLFSTLNPDPNNPIYYAHNVYLDELVELGALGGLALVLVLVRAMTSAFRRRSTLGFAMLAAWATANLFDDALYEPRPLTFLAAAFALAAAGGVALQRRGPTAAPPATAPPATAPPTTAPPATAPPTTAPPATAPPATAPPGSAGPPPVRPAPAPRAAPAPARPAEMPSPWLVADHPGG